jgi:hypothetical protein
MEIGGVNQSIKKARIAASFSRFETHVSTAA